MACLRCSGLILPSAAKTTRPCLLSRTIELVFLRKAYDT